MANIGKIKPQQISKAKLIIAALPQRDIFCSREEAAEQLADDFRLAFKKGYSPKEVCAMLKFHGLLIPEEIVVKYQGYEDDGEIDVNQLLHICGKASEKKKAAAFRKSAASNADSHVYEKRKGEKGNGQNSGNASGESSGPVAKQPEAKTKKQSARCEISDAAAIEHEEPQSQSADTASKIGWPENPQVVSVQEKMDQPQSTIINSKDESLRQFSENFQGNPAETVNSTTKPDLFSAESASQDEKNGIPQAEKPALASGKSSAVPSVEPPKPRAKAWDEDLENWHSPLNDTSGYGTFTIKPDTPIGEL